MALPSGAVLGQNGALRFAVHSSFIITFWFCFNHYFSENDPVGLNFSMFSIQLKASFSACAL